LFIIVFKYKFFKINNGHWSLQFKLKIVLKSMFENFHCYFKLLAPTAKDRTIWRTNYQGYRTWYLERFLKLGVESRHAKLQFKGQKSLQEFEKIGKLKMLLKRKGLIRQVKPLGNNLYTPLIISTSNLVHVLWYQLNASIFISKSYLKINCPLLYCGKKISSYAFASF